ncbi:hypothetical protein DHEL01_v201699 [Diaporthe helianthi]|uniref:Uncharacterized protein n=1 Tax=Diaporthe helianthi TaxID=158607 RepID=A0A2P5IBN0_DIAHE|nr:hypothetical protein DHEL01_v201699 [Diaporthe helianthi]
MQCARARGEPGGEPAVGGVRANRRRPREQQSIHWDRGGGEGAWEKRAQAAARPAFDTVLVTCDNWPTTPLPSILQPVTDGPKNLEISSEELPSRPWSYPV